MKRTVTILLCVALMLVCLCACGSNEEEPPITSITRDPADSETVTTTTTTTTTDADKGTDATTPSSTVVAPSSTESTGTTATTTTPSTAVPTTPTSRPTVTVGGDTSETGAAIAQTAVDLIGSPFRFGGNGPESFDNPGFVAYCYKQHGYTVSRTLSAALSFGVEAPTDALQAGDLLLFCEDGSGNPTFAGIYIGGGRFVACKNPASGTVDQPLSNTYWLPLLVAARRIG